MALPMDQTTFLAFYRDTMQSYSKSFKRYTVKLLKDKGLITFDEQVDFGSAQYVEKGTTISSTTMNPRFSGFYELLEFIRINRITISAGASGLLLSFCSAAVSCIMPQKASFSKTFCHKLPDFT